ncbi:MAG: DUF4838 domain-containing protein [Clostridia bacterium]|nr:DUF4838 domain-containing protein [Clostridia bacterium]
MKKLLILLLAAALVLPCLMMSCNNNTPEVTTPTDVVTPPAETTTPDDSSNPENPPKETELTLTSVNVTTGEDVAEAFAAAELLAYLNKKGITSSKDGFPITISIDSALEHDCFKIEASFDEETRGMTIRGGDRRGILYAVYQFLEKYAGFRYFTPDIETYTADAVVIPEGVVMDHTPVLGARRITWHSIYSSMEWAVKLGANFGISLPQIFGGQSLDYGSLFVHTIAPLAGTKYPYPTYATNPCLTDPEIFNTVIANLRKELEKNPNINIVSVSQSDYEQSCYCPNCRKIAEEEGSYSGVWIYFVNKVAEELTKDYPDLIIDTLAYKNTQKAPKNIKPHQNVCVRLCSITCCFTHPIDDPNCSKNKTFRDDLVAWGKICDNIHIWDYTTNFHYYISTFANLDVIRANMKFFAENNAVSMFPQGNSQGKSGEFGELRTYLLCKLMLDPYMTEEEYSNHMDEFLQAYYGEGWTYIREFIDKTTELAANGGFKLDGNEQPTNAVCGQGIYDHPLTVITRQEYLANEALFDELWAKAKELAGDRIENVKRSEMQWRLTKLYLHPNAAQAQQLIDDAKAAGVVWKEGLPNVQSSSDLSKSPYYWSYGN